MRTLRIGEAAKLTGVSSANIRFYEKEGLLPAAKRQDNAYRSYGEADLHRLRFIRTCRAMDMSLDEVRTLLALDWSRPSDCCAATQTLDQHLGHVRQRLTELHMLEAELLALRQCCNGIQHGPDGTAHNRCGILTALHAQAEAPQWLSAEPTTIIKRHV